MGRRVNTDVYKNLVSHSRGGRLNSTRDSLVEIEHAVKFCGSVTEAQTTNQWLDIRTCS